MVEDAAKRKLSNVLKESVEHTAVHVL